MAASLNNPAWLEWMSTLVGEGARHSYAGTLPPDRFYCVLDELPLHLVPRQAVAALQAHNSDQRLFLNPGCRVCAHEELPEELAEWHEELSRFALRGTMAWVRDSAGGCLQPFWLRSELESVLRGLEPGAPAPLTLPNSARGSLVGAGILIPEGHQQSEQRRKAAVEKSATAFQQKGYAPVAELIHPFHIAALRRYYRYLIRTGAIKLGDGQSPRRYVAYNEPVARFFHRAIAAKLSALAGQALKPSYVYLASYLSGAELKKHTDREQCEFSITLCLDFSPEPALATPWPIRLDTPAGTITVYQALGDGLAYRGTRLPHYRDALGAGQTSTSIFFHYVPVEFAGSLD